MLENILIFVFIALVVWILWPHVRYSFSGTNPFSDDQKKQLKSFLSKWDSYTLIVLRKYTTQQSPQQDLIDRCTLAIDDNPKNKVLFYNRGKAYLSLRDYYEAIADFNEAILLDLMCPRILCHLEFGVSGGIGMAVT
ncbi:hypothetical protein KKB99_08215 [bacterium]|nr:hypothetical protein [bacterium]MBU1025975.1 hypothetical protein [bacterium]